MKKFLLLVLTLFFSGCSCSSEGKGTLRIGIDPNWYPIDFGLQTSYVNGFTEDLLMEVAQFSGVRFEKVAANWDSLLQGLKEEKYDAVITSLPPYEYNNAKYDFSENILDLGPVLIVPADSNLASLDKMKGMLIGLIVDDPATPIVEKQGDLIIRNYNSIPDLLKGVMAGEVSGALLARLPAVNYVNDLYAGKLKIASAPLTEAGLHLLVPKGKYFISTFNKSLAHLKKKKKLQALLKKWNLDVYTARD